MGNNSWLPHSCTARNRQVWTGSTDTHLHPPAMLLDCISLGLEPEVDISCACMK